MIPRKCPEELRNLSQVEEMLISPILPMMTMYKLPKGGQHLYRGHTICFPQDLDSFVPKLPRGRADPNIIVVRREGHTKEDVKDVRVRKTKILTALNWLKKHNPYFCNITIDNNCELPEDGIWDGEFVSVALDGEAAENEEDITETGPDGEHSGISLEGSYRYSIK
jgi:hypothetical protein